MNSYTGASGKVITRAELAKLGSSYALTPKMDGIFGTVATDDTGRLASIVTRAGKPLGPHLLAEFEGVQWTPSSVIVAEIELWTEPSNRAAQARGYRMIYPFDCLRVAGVDVSREVYRVRRDALLRAEVELEARDPDRPWHEDDHRRAHDLTSGQYTRRVPLGWRRVRVVPQVPVAHAESAWSEWVSRQLVGPCEGLVAVALDAPIGKAKAKRKVKTAATIDVVVSDVRARALNCYWPQAKQRVVVARPRSLAVAAGDVIELTHEGFYESGLPKFARVARTRPDLN